MGRERQRLNEVDWFGQSEPSGRVSSLCFISASSASNTDGKNRRGREDRQR